MEEEKAFEFDQNRPSDKYVTYKLGEIVLSADINTKGAPQTAQIAELRADTDADVRSLRAGKLDIKDFFNNLDTRNKQKKLIRAERSAATKTERDVRSEIRVVARKSLDTCEEFIPASSSVRDEDKGIIEEWQAEKQRKKEKRQTKEKEGKKGAK